MTPRTLSRQDYRLQVYPSRYSKLLGRLSFLGLLGVFAVGIMGLGQ